MTSRRRSVISVLPGSLRIGCLVPLLISQMSRAVSESVKSVVVSAMFRAACMVRSFGCPRRWCQMFAPAIAIAVADIAGVVVAIAVGSPGEVVGAPKDIVLVEAKAALMHY